MRHSYGWPRHFAYAGKNCSDKSTYFTHGYHRGGGTGFGVRRPLRYLAHHLDLDESQTRRMASVLNQMKTEREQAKLDEKRTVSALAALMSERTPTLDEVKGVLEPRVRSTERLNLETAKAVAAISDFLDEDQKDEFINLLLTGSISL